MMMERSRSRNVVCWGLAVLFMSPTMCSAFTLLENRQSSCSVSTTLSNHCSVSTATTLNHWGSTTCARRLATPTRLRSLLGDDEEEEEDDDDDETDDPLRDGVDSVAWLPALDTTTMTPASSKDNKNDTTEILPLFPLGGIVYTPNSEHILNIFEPRYRQMYSDILMNGSKRFAVAMSHPHEKGRFAVVGVLFELQELKEVSEQTKDQIKFICNHKVTGRVKIHRVLNPEAWTTRDTYLRVEGTILDDSGDKVETEEESPREQKLLRGSFSEMVDMQYQLSEDVRFTKSSVSSVAVKPGAGEDGLWQTIKLWQSFVDQRLLARQNELQRDFQVKLQNFLKKDKGFSKDQMPSAVGFQDLPQDLQNEVLELQKSMALELQPLVLESQLTMQKILECPDHVSRLQLVRTFIEAETKRLRTKKTLQSMFASTSSTTPLPATPPKSDKVEKSSSDSSIESTSFFGDDDAFQ